MFTLNKILTIFEENDKLYFEGQHYETGESVFTGDLWRLWPSKDGLESENQSRLRSIMERKNMQLRFQDETIRDDNGKVHESQSNSYGWIPTFTILNECEVWSKQDAEENISSYCEALLNSELKERLDQWDIDFSSVGFEKFDYSAEAGFHPGQNDTPESVAEMITKAHGECDIIFSLDGKGQFDIAFSAWFRKEKD